ncbi:MAG: bifunctional glutamate N-acetyltransferase/amino-acid acetyltransferase ArgJ [bacterium]
MPDLTIPKGYLFSVTEAAIKKPGRKDMGLIFSEKEAVAAGTFTTNRVKAAPVRLDMKRIRSGKGQAIVMNSGNANTCTGEQGMSDALEMAGLPAHLLGINPSRVYVCSTGVIGNRMPMERIREAMPNLAGNLGKFSLGDIAAAIMTTDTFPKMNSREITIAGKTVTIAACAKGAGMIAPRMATMLCFILTDASIEQMALKAALRNSVGNSFNRITIDGDMSTNDTALIFANGLAGNQRITAGSRNYRIFQESLHHITYQLAEMIVRDGEGAKKLIEIEVLSARSEKDAEKAAKAVANSLLVKTALYGNDANWGRIMAALGYSGVVIQEDKIDISFDGLKIVEKGLSTGKDKEANELLKKNHIRLAIDLHAGKSGVKVLTCDLSEDYIKINAEYRT